MRRAARIDANQKEIVNYARQLCISVHVQSQAGQGTLDLTLNGIPAEVKNPKQKPSQRRLRSKQAEYIFKNYSFVVESKKDIDLFLSNPEQLRQKSLQKAKDDLAYYQQKMYKHK